MRKSQAVHALEYAKEKYKLQALTLRQIYNIRFETELNKKLHAIAGDDYYSVTESYSVFSGNLYREVVSRVHPKIKRRKNKANLWEYYLA